MNQTKTNAIELTQEAHKWEIVHIKIKKNTNILNSISQDDRNIFLKRKRKLVSKISKLIKSQNDLKDIRNRLIKCMNNNKCKSLISRHRKNKDMNILMKVNCEISMTIDRKIIEEKKICSICFEETNFSSRFYLKCGHFFHNSCLSTWFKVNKKCPICRIELHDLSIDNNFEEDRNEESEIIVSEEDNYYYNIIFLLVLYLLTWSLIRTIGIIKYTTDN